LRERPPFGRSSQFMAKKGGDPSITALESRDAELKFRATPAIRQSVNPQSAIRQSAIDDPQSAIIRSRRA
jgi:hypothetical protein